MTKIYRHSALCLILTTLVCTLLISCGSEKPTQEENGARVDFQLKWPVAKSVGSPVPPGVDMIRVSLSGPGMLTKSFDFDVNARTGTIDNVPAGDNRTITFQGFSGPNIIYEKVSPPVKLEKGVPFSENFLMDFMSNVFSASPSGVSAEAVSSGQINLSWVDNSNNENSYIIERKSGAEANYTTLAIVAANDTIYSDTKISSDTTYDYRVLADNGTGPATGASATTSGVVSASTYSISGTVTSGGAALVDATVTRSGNGTTTIKVENGNYNFSGVQNGSYTLTPAMPDYIFDPSTRVVTVDSASQSVATFSAIAVTAVPISPTRLDATAPSSNLINLAWTDTENETGYKIYRKTEFGVYTLIKELAGNVTTYNDATVAAGTTYIYQLWATNLNGDSGYGTEASVKTPEKTYSISGTITGDGLVLVGVTVTLTGTGSTTAVTNTSGSYSFTGVREGNYTLTQVKEGYVFPAIHPISVNGANLSVTTIEATPNSIPAIPTALIATPTSASRINLDWKDNANNEAGFEIQRSRTGADGTYEWIYTTSANVTTYNDLSFTGSTTYYYRIRATNSVEPSAYTADEVKATTITTIEPMLVSVIGGTYNMGDTFGDGGQANELPFHQVTVRDFSIGKFEVTRGEWFAVMRVANPNTPSFDWSEYPVVNVSWTAIQEFITTLNGLSGKRYRLPTEAEWEYAAAVRIDGVKEKYSGGSDTGAVSWYKDNSGNATHKVGSTIRGNSRGIYDMSGNVFEWVSDRYGTYSRFPQTNPAGPVSGLERVTRGGGYQSRVVNVRTTFRASAVPNYIDPRIGFRLAISAP